MFTFVGMCVALCFCIWLAFKVLGKIGALLGTVCMACLTIGAASVGIIALSPLIIMAIAAVACVSAAFAMVF